MVHIGGDILSRGLQIGQQGRTFADELKVFDLQWHSDFTRDRQKVEHGIG